VELIIAEKPAVARDLARVLGVRPSGEHCFESADRVITWCVGHLVELDEPASYDPRWKAWRLDTLPMLPAEFRLRPSRHASAQLRAVTRLLADRRFRSVVNACDAGREGELIFRYLVQFAGRCPKVQRLWISSLTDEAIRRGFAALRPGAQFDPLADAARSRSEADWLVGMNATRAITARGRAAGDTALYSIGRVQTPTLAMLVRREQAIRAFVPKPYWEVRGTFTTTDGARFTAAWRHGAAARLGTAALADALVARDTAHGGAADPIGPRVERVRARTVREPPPLFFDLTALQRTANRRFGWSAARTLELAQALYERHKAITYPRTDARHLSSDVARELPTLFASLAELPDYAAFAGELVAHPPRPSRRIVDDSKVHDHHAIIPTGKPVRSDGLDRDAWRLFDLIARRFLAAFFPDAEFAVTEAWIRVGAAIPGAPPPTFAAAEPAERAAASDRAATADRAAAEPSDGDVPILDRLPPEPDRYLARGRVRVVAGWQAVAGIDGAAAAREAARRRDGEPDADPPQPLPPLREGQPLDGSFAALAKQTTPPRRYTEATLLGAMESAGKAIDDEALRLAMKDCGLGTPATRAAIIETLLARDYIERARQDLAPTARGIALIEALPVASLASPELTGAWEARLARIARGQDTRAAFMADIARYVVDTVDAIRAADPPAAPPAPAGGTAAYPQRGRRRWQRRPTGGNRNGSRRNGQGARRGSRRTFDRDRSRDLAAAPRAAAAAGSIPDLTCPRCGMGTLITGSRGWGCARWREGCRFVIWFETAGRRLTAAQLRDLVIRGKTRKARFRSERGELDARLVLDPTADGGARLEPA
jgi:DNA topoisomerase-3